MDCDVCKERRPMVCKACANGYLTGRYALLKKLTEQREALRSQLNAKLRVRRQTVPKFHRNEHAQRRVELSRLLNDKKLTLARNRMKLARLACCLDEGHSRLDSARALLPKRRIELFECYFPHSLEAHARNQRALCSSIAGELPVVLKVLSVFLPLHFTYQKDGGMVLRICGFRLPCGDDDFHSIEPEVLVACLGLMLLLAKLLARYLDVTLVHNPAFAALSIHARENRCLKHDDGMKDWQWPLPKRVLDEAKEDFRLLKNNISCLCEHGYGLLSSQIPSNLSRFDALARLLQLYTSEINGLQERLEDPCVSRIRRCALSLHLKNVKKKTKKKPAAKPDHQKIGLLDSPVGASMVESLCDGISLLKTESEASSKSSASSASSWNLVKSELLPPIVQK